jgi:ABC-2 type transport system ATP-binding protein
MTILEVRDLHKSFGEIRAVAGLDFTVHRGDIYGLLGVNGSGKSTTIRMLLHLIKPDRGRITITGVPVNGHNLDLRKKMGALIERPDFYNYLTAFKNLEILMKYSGFRPDRTHILETLNRVGLEKFWNKKVGIFSQGMKQRLGIAQALLHDPELIILDEPANGLDPHGMVDIRNLIMRLNREHGKTIILSSHMLNEIEMIASRMLIIDGGKAIAEGTVTELLQSYESRVRLQVSDGVKALMILKKAGYEQVEKKGNNEVICQVAEEEVPEVNRLLVKNDIWVQAIVPEKSLEEYFISLT